MPRLKQVFGLRWLKILIRIVPFFITVLTCYMANIFWNSILSATKIVVIADNLWQIYIRGQNISFCITWLLLTTIALGFLRVLIRGLSAQQKNRLVVSRLGLGFIFKRFGGFLFLVRPPTPPTTNFHSSNANKWPKCNFAFGINNLSNSLS